MTIYVDNGETVKTYYLVKVKVAKAVMTLLETDNELVWSETDAGLVWSETDAGYGVAIVDKAESEDK